MFFGLALGSHLFSFLGLALRGNWPLHNPGHVGTTLCCVESVGATICWSRNSISSHGALGFSLGIPERGQLPQPCEKGTGISVPDPRSIEPEM